jgi:chromosome partitioning protein
MMPIITVASTKGGVGKSTFILNLATILLHKGKKVVVLDGDVQNTLTKWNRVREFMIAEGAPLKSLFVASAQGNALLEIANDKKGQGYVVLIDSPGVDDTNMRAALIRSDFIITTCPPSSVDLWEVETLLKVLKKLQVAQGKKTPLMLVFNKVPSTHSQNATDEALRFFEQNNICPDHVLRSLIKDRVSFKHSIRDGKGVVEYFPSDTKAIDEITNCCREILAIIRSHEI